MRKRQEEERAPSEEPRLRPFPELCFEHFPKSCAFATFLSFICHQLPVTWKDPHLPGAWETSGAPGFRAPTAAPLSLALRAGPGHATARQRKPLKRSSAPPTFPTIQSTLRRPGDRNHKIKVTPKEPPRQVKTDLRGGAAQPGTPKLAGGRSQKQAGCFQVRTFRCKM